MAQVLGVDFGALSVRVSVVDSERGLLDSAIAEYPLHRKRGDREYATQSQVDHLRAIVSITHEALQKAKVSGDKIEAIALDTAGSSVIPVEEKMQPLGEYYLRCDWISTCTLVPKELQVAVQKFIAILGGELVFVQRPGCFRISG